MSDQIFSAMDDAELTATLETVRQKYGGDLSAFFRDAMEEAKKPKPIARLGQIRDALGLAMTAWSYNTVGGRKSLTGLERERWQQCEEALGVSYEDWHAIYFGASRLPDKVA